MRPSRAIWPALFLFFALATPAIFLLYQLTVVGHLPFAMAFTGLALGFIYLAGARLTWKRQGQTRPYAAQVYFTLAVTGLNLALLFAGLDTGASRAVMLFYLGVVWVVQGKRVERRAVTVSATHGEETEVSAGLAAGERVVVKPPAELKDGDAVKEIKS